MIKIIFLTRAGTCNVSFIRSHCYVFTQALDARDANSTNALVPVATLRTEWLLTNNWPIPVAARVCDLSLLVFRVWIRPEAWICVCCESFELSGRGLCFCLITHPEMSYLLCCVRMWSPIVDKDEALAYYGLLHHGEINNIQGDSVARVPKLLSIKNYVIEIITWKSIYTYRDLLIIDAETGLLSHPNTLECVSPNSGIIFPNLFGASSERITLY